MLCPPDPLERAAVEAESETSGVASAVPSGDRAGRLETPISDPSAPRPIGPERLRALREAIRSGAYPPDDAVMGGLVRMFRKPETAPERPAGR